jgi:hypothetical protein
MAVFSQSCERESVFRLVIKRKVAAIAFRSKAVYADIESKIDDSSCIRIRFCK